MASRSAVGLSARSGTSRQPTAPVRGSAASALPRIAPYSASPHRRAALSARWAAVSVTFTTAWLQALRVPGASSRARLAYNGAAGQASTYAPARESRIDHAAGAPPWAHEATAQRQGQRTALVLRGCTSSAAPTSGPASDGRPRWADGRAPGQARRLPSAADPAAVRVTTALAAASAPPSGSVQGRAAYQP